MPSHTPALDAICSKIEGQFHSMHRPLSNAHYARAQPLLREAGAMHLRYEADPAQPLTGDFAHDQLLIRAQSLLEELLDERAAVENAATRDQRLDEQEARIHAAKVAQAEATGRAAERRRVGLDG